MTPRRKSLAVIVMLIPMISTAGSTAVEPAGRVHLIAPSLTAPSPVPDRNDAKLFSSIELPQPSGWATWWSAVIAVAFVVRRKSNWQ